MEIPLIKKGIGGVYGIRNILTGKIYIGSSKSIRGRLFSHRNDLQRGVHTNSCLQHAFNKYFQENFELIVLELVEDVNKLVVREQFYINFYKSGQREFGYNLIVDAVRKIPSLETRQKMSESAKGKIVSEEARKKLSKAHKGRKWTPELRKKNGEYWTQENRNKVSEQSRKREKPSKESIEKSAQKRRGRKWSEEERKKHEGRKLSEESKQKMSEAKLGKKLTLEQRERRKMFAPRGESHHNFGKELKQETKDKISKTKKERKISINGKPILKMSLSGEILERFESVVDAQKQFGPEKTIYKVCNKNKPAYGFLWIYAFSPLKKRILSQESRDRISAASKTSKKVTRPIVQISESGEILRRYDSITEATEIFNCKYKIKDALRNKKSTLGFRWEYAFSYLK